MLTPAPRSVLPNRLALSMMSRSVTHLQRVIDRDDMVAIKALQIRMSLLEMTDAMRGYLLDPSNQAEAQRKLAADSVFTVRVRELKQLEPSKEVLQKVEQAEKFDESTLNQVEAQVLSLTKANKIAEARELYDGQYLAARGLHAALMDDMERLSDRDKQVAVEAAAANQRRARVGEQCDGGRAVWYSTACVGAGHQKDRRVGTGSRRRGDGGSGRVAPADREFLYALADAGARRSHPFTCGVVSTQMPLEFRTALSRLFMRFSSLLKTGLLALGLATVSSTAQAQGSLVVSHDEWLTGPGTFGVSEQQFLTNVLNFFGAGSGSNVLVYSSNGFLTNGTFTNFLTAAGLNVTINDAAASFGSYSVVFGGGNPSQNSAGLASYVIGGGHVFYEGGTGNGGAAAEAAYANPFLNAFGLAFTPVYNGLNTVNTSAFSGQAPYGAALFTGVPNVFANNGNNVVGAAPVSGVATQIFDDGSGNGVIGVAQVVTATPEPASLALLATGLFALVPVARRRMKR